ncbi:MAG: hypothetical protein ACFFCI_00955 [Promethearchaeota archaeon]
MKKIVHTNGIIKNKALSTTIRYSMPAITIGLFLMYLQWIYLGVDYGSDVVIARSLRIALIESAFALLASAFLWSSFGIERLRYRILASIVVFAVSSIFYISLGVGFGSWDSSMMMYDAGFPWSIVDMKIMMELIREAIPIFVTILIIIQVIYSMFAGGIMQAIIEAAICIIILVVTGQFVMPYF